MPTSNSAVSVGATKLLTSEARVALTRLSQAPRPSGTLIRIVIFDISGFVGAFKRPEVFKYEVLVLSQLQ